MVDLRERVTEDRGLLKKLELAIPGFRGYRKREDLRIADSLLRKQLANNLGKIREKMELARQDLTKKMEMDLIDNMAQLMNNITSTENRVRHAEQGYSGISADFNVREDELNKIYEWDLNLLSDLENLSNSASSLQSTISTGNKTDINQKINEVESEIREFNSLFDKRIQSIADLGV
jgi:DNA primase catalytic subunit